MLQRFRGELTILDSRGGGGGASEYGDEEQGQIARGGDFGRSSPHGAPARPGRQARAEEAPLQRYRRRYPVLNRPAVRQRLAASPRERTLCRRDHPRDVKDRSIPEHLRVNAEGGMRQAVAHGSCGDQFEIGMLLL